MEAVCQALAEHRNRLLALENVVGVGYGYKTVGGESTGEPAITVMVKKKLRVKSLTSGQVVPKRLNRVATDVIETGEFKLLYRTERMRPAKPGVSIGHYRVTAGTFGALVRDARTGEVLILSNNHVLANITDGTDHRVRIGDSIWQPGKYDGGSEEDSIARLTRFVPLYRPLSRNTCGIARKVEGFVNSLLRLLTGGYEVRFLKLDARVNLVDAAVARPIKDEWVSPEILGIGEVKGTVEPELGMAVKKSGRTSGITTGEIIVLDAAIKVMMGDIGSAMFHEQVVTTPMAEPGDSGSLIVTENNQAVALLAAGSEQASLGGTIQNVTRLLNIRF